jgi:hypothetical protein
MAAASYAREEPMAKTVSDDCREILEEIEEQLLAIDKDLWGFTIAKSYFNPKPYLEVIRRAKKTVVDADCTEILNDVEEHLLSVRKEMSKEYNRLVTKIRGKLRPTRARVTNGSQHLMSLRKTAARRSPWTKADERELRTLARKRSPIRIVVKSMKRTRGALRQKAYSLGLSLGHRRSRKKKR